MVYGDISGFNFMKLWEYFVHKEKKMTLFNNFLPHCVYIQGLSSHYPCNTVLNSTLLFYYIVS